MAGLLTARCQEPARSMQSVRLCTMTIPTTKEKSMHDKDAITWFEIPALDLDRAARFYETVLDRKLKRESKGPLEMAVFPYKEPGVGGCVTHGQGHAPGPGGNIVYLNAGPAIDPALARVNAAGGTVALSRTALPEGMGFFAHIIDTEGNRVGLHALK